MDTTDSPAPADGIEAMHSARVAFMQTMTEWEKDWALAYLAGFTPSGADAVIRAIERQRSAAMVLAAFKSGPVPEGIPLVVDELEQRRPKA